MKILKAPQKAWNLFPLIVLLILTSCGGQNNETKPQAETTVMDKTDVQANVKEIIEYLPSPYELSKKLNLIGAEYNESAINSVDKLDKYFTEKSKSLNLGVYSVDLAYVSTFDKKQEVNLYANTVKALVDQLNIKVDMENLVSDEMKEKIENKDSLALIMTNTFYDVYDFLNENSDPSLAALAATGLWVEGLYLAMQISEETYQSTEFLELILEQKVSLDKIIELLSMFEEDEIIKVHRDALVKLQSYFNLENGGLKADDLKSINQIISTIRSSIVE